MNFIIIKNKTLKLVFIWKNSIPYTIKIGKGYKLTMCFVLICMHYMQHYLVAIKKFLSFYMKQSSWHFNTRFSFHFLRCGVWNLDGYAKGRGLGVLILSIALVLHLHGYSSLSCCQMSDQGLQEAFPYITCFPEVECCST